ncbi:MAG: hypothetical protein ABEH88_09660 [Halobacteriales archaeon]
MDGNRSLEEFVGQSGSRTGDESDPLGAGGVAREESGEESSDNGEGVDPDPIATTYRWSAEGGICGVCGERVESRWHSGEAFVCADCKEW